MATLDEDVLTVAQTVWGEARGEPWEGMIAVAWVIRNRVDTDLGSDRKPDWWGEGYKEVCLKPYQFSCWRDIPTLYTKTPKDLGACYKAAEAVLEGIEEDPTEGATHYHTIKKPRWASVWPPKWVKTLTSTVRIGGHVFYQ